LAKTAVRDIFGETQIGMMAEKRARIPLDAEPSSREDAPHR